MMPAPAPLAIAAADVALLARRLFAVVAAAFRLVSPEARGPILSAVDGFLAAPAPSTFLIAFRVADRTRHRALIERAGARSLRRSFDDGVAALRQVSSLPAALVDGLVAGLPRDVRAGRRLNALAALAATYQELGTRVAADTDQRRRRWTGLPRRRARR